MPEPDAHKTDQRRKLGRRDLLKSTLAASGGYALAAPVTEAGMRLDVHQHAILPEYQKALERSGVVENSNLKAKVFTRQTILDVMGEMGMNASVLLPFSSAGIHHGNDANARYLTEVTNNAMAKLVSEAPQKLGFYAILPLPDLTGALKQMQYALDQLHADGVAFLTTQNGVYLGDPAYDELYAEMNRRSVAAFVHPARPTYALPLKLFPSLIEYTFDTTRTAVNLIYNGVLKRYPNIRWILAHAGGALPYISERLEVLEGEDRQKPAFLERMPEGFTPYLKRFYYDVAIAGAAAPVSALSAIADPSRIFYGSDWPYVPKEYILAQVKNLRGMPQFAGPRLQAMERKNALALFPRFA